MAKGIYTVHTRAWSSATDGDAVFVREGFAWAALLFGPLWALWHGHWRTAIGLLILSISASGVVVVVGMSTTGEAAVRLALQLGVGLWANDWRRYILGRREQRMRAVVAGKNLGDAEDHYFSRAP